MRVGFLAALPRPLFPQLGPKGRLYVATSAAFTLAAVAHPHCLDWAWSAVGAVGGILNAWKAATSTPESSPPSQVEPPD